MEGDFNAYTLIAVNAPIMRMVFWDFTGCLVYKKRMTFLTYSEFQDHIRKNLFKFTILNTGFNLRFYMYFIWEGGYHPSPSDFDGSPYLQGRGYDQTDRIG